MSKLEITIGSGNQHKVEEIQHILRQVPAIDLVPFPDQQALGEIDETGKTFAENAGIKASLCAKYLYASQGASASGRHTAIATDDTSSIDVEAARRAHQEAERMLELDRQGAFGSRVISSDAKRIRRSDFLVIADDSGLVVDALGGAPGIFSARYAGNHGDDAANNAKLLDAMKDVPDDQRSARFVCSIALATQDDVVFTVEGKVEGTITRELRGDKGFGYDPLFYYPPFEATFGEVSPSAKDSVSHRSNALKLFKSRLMRVLTQEGLV